jgi:hypothetical protein
MIYLDGLEPVCECGPGQEDNGPGEDGPRGPKAHCVDGAESNACLHNKVDSKYYVAQKQICVLVGYFL